MAKRIKVKARTSPSSTRKKLVREGNRKFIGPRTERSASSEKYDRGIYAPSTMHHVERGTKKVRVPEENQVVRESGRYPYNSSLSTVPDGPQWGKGNIAKKKGKLELLLKRQEAKRASTRPSSTRKKRVKEGNRKFVGPRQRISELNEIQGRMIRDPSVHLQRDSRTRMLGRDWSEEADLDIESIGSERLKNMLRKFLHKRGFPF